MDKIRIGLAGRLYAFAQMIERGLFADALPRNFKNGEIVVRSQKGKCPFRVVIKTTSKEPRLEKDFSKRPCYVWPMNQKLESVPDNDLFYCFVALQETKLPKFFIVPAWYAATYTLEQHKRWLKLHHTPIAKSIPARFRISVYDPKGFEDNWEVLEGKPIPPEQLSLDEPWSRV